MVLRLRRYERILIGNRRFEGSWSVSAEFSRSRKRTTRTISARIVRPMNALSLSLTVFTQRNFVADFLQLKSNLTRKTAVFEPPLGV